MNENFYELNTKKPTTYVDEQAVAPMLTTVNEPAPAVAEPIAAWTITRPPVHCDTTCMLRMLAALFRALFPDIAMVSVSPDASVVVKLVIFPVTAAVVKVAVVPTTVTAA